jgi:FtsZ-interacting cell division protein ZipA
LSTTALILIIVVIVIVVLLLALFFASRRRAAQRSEEQRERTREAFGSEYERMTQERGSEEAERELRERRGRIERRVEPLSEESCAHYKEQWGEVERVFVDNPERSIEMADRLRHPQRAQLRLRRGPVRRGDRAGPGRNAP